MAHIRVLSAGPPTDWTHYHVAGCELSDRIQGYAPEL